MSLIAPIDLAGGEGEALWYDSGLMTVKASTAQTQGDYFVFEMLTQRGKMTPLHAHPDEDEIFYILDGELLVHTDGHESTRGAGSFLVTPRNTPHSFAVVSDTARFLCMAFPAGKAEAFFRATAVAASARELPPLTPPDVEGMMRAAQATGVVVLGPPPFPQLVGAED